MALADTARLAVQLDLQGNFTSGLVSAEAGLTRFSGGLSKIGGALSHAKNQIGGLLSGPLGLIGLTGGLLSFGGAVKETLGKLNDLAFGTERLTAITGDSAQSLSTLIASTEKYGISVDKLAVIAGFYEKTAGKLNETSAKGVVVGKSAELLSLEAIKNERIAAGLSTTKINRLIREQKARDALAASETTAAAGISNLVALQKQYGVQLVDGQGKALSFNAALLNVADAYAQSTDKSKAAALAATLFGRSWQTLAPVLALGKEGILDLEKEAAAMGLQLSEQNVADFARYREAIRGSQEAIAGLEVAIGEDLLPTISDLAKGVQSFVTSHKTDIVNFFHNAVEAGKDAARVIGGLASAVGGFWSSIPPEVRDLLTKGLVADRTVKFLFGFSPVTNLFGEFFARGSSAANPMYVTGLGAGSAGGGLGILGGAAIAVTIVGIAQEVADAMGFRQNRQDLQQNFGLTSAQALALQIEGRGGLGSMDARSRAGALTQFMDAGTTYAAALAAAHAVTNLSGKLVDTMNAGDRSWRDNTDALRANTATLEAWATGSLSGRLAHSVAPGSQVNAWLHSALRIATSSESTDKKIAELTRIQKDLREGGHHQVYFLDRLLAVERAKQTTVNVTLISQMSVSDVTRKITVRQTYRTSAGNFIS